MYQKTEDIRLLVIAVIAVMLLLFVSFLIAFIAVQRKKLKYHKNLQIIHEQQQIALVQQNKELEKRVGERTFELSEQKENLQIALAELKSSQTQLVQKEKMASLGEVASGIAHEIQNPLNFVNNFGEINVDLLSELKFLLAAKYEKKDAKDEIDSLIENILDNLKKINVHGKRAESIVKNMLQHTRSGNAKEELFEVNFLVDEYFRLAYNRFRAKHNNFNVNLATNYDERLKKINGVAQDIGQVLINIYSNSFYSVHEKFLRNSDFKPAVSVCTTSIENRVIITIRDNGVGIPSKYLDKIFQPFFTTKPTGVGTGLGLSLSYDIIKAHGGEIKASSVEGEFAEFTVELLCD